MIKIRILKRIMIWFLCNISKLSIFSYKFDEKIFDLASLPYEVILEWSILVITKNQKLLLSIVYFSCFIRIQIYFQATLFTWYIVLTPNCTISFQFYPSLKTYKPPVTLFWATLCFKIPSDSVAWSLTVLE